MINKLIGAMLAVVVGVVMLPVIIDSVNTLTDDNNATVIARLGTGVGALVNLLPLLFVIIIIGGVIAYIAYRK